MLAVYKISICIPAYNHPHLLQQCLQSIIAQTYTDLEVIVTDDSLHDDLANVVANIGDDRIKYFKNVTQLGSPQNWNEGIKHATGQLIKIMHHDDWFVDANCLSEFVKPFINNPTIDFAFSQCYNVTTTSSKLYATNYKYINKIIKKPNLLLFGNMIGAPSVIIFTKKVANTIVFNKYTSWYVDVIFYVEVFNKFSNIFYIQKPLVNITSGSSLQVTNSTPEIKKFAEALYTFQVFKYFTLPFIPWLLSMHLTELSIRYNCNNATLKNNGISDDVLNKIKLSLIIAKLPVNYKFFALIRRFALKYLPYQIL